MTIYRFEPDPRDTPGLLGALGAIVGLATNPVETVIGLAVDKAGKSGGNSPMYPVEVDTETNQVTVFARQGKEKGRGVLLNQMARDYASTTQAFLQQVYDTGLVTMTKDQRAYRGVAQDVAKLKPPSAPSSQPAPPEVIQLPRGDTGQNFMGGFIPPGGMAGFSQMTPVSQLALTGRRRAGGGGRKRRRKSAKRSKTRKTAKRTRRGKAKRFVKGSAAAKRYMAKIRRKRRK
jgi:hypothetical protein